MLNKLIVYAAFMAVLCTTSLVSAHTGYHYAGLKGSVASTDLISVRMMMPTKPTHCKKGCHVIGWTILWDAYATGEYLEAGIGYVPRKSKKVTLWYATPNHPYVNRVATVPFGTWVWVTIYKPLGEARGYVRWEWEENGEWKSVERTRSLPGWTGNRAYHPTKAEVLSKKKTHPGNVSIWFDGVPAFEGDTYDWHVDGQWTPYGTFEAWEVR